jgi:hypothetical protein
LNSLIAGDSIRAIGDRWPDTLATHSRYIEAVRPMATQARLRSSTARRSKPPRNTTQRRAVGLTPSGFCVCAGANVWHVHAHLPLLAANRPKFINKSGQRESAFRNAQSSPITEQEHRLAARPAHRFVRVARYIAIASGPTHHGSPLRLVIVPGVAVKLRGASGAGESWAQ